MSLFSEETFLVGIEAFKIKKPVWLDRLPLPEPTGADHSGLSGCWAIHDHNDDDASIIQATNDSVCIQATHPPCQCGSEGADPHVVLE